jgi:hypothetical protein
VTVLLVLAALVGVAYIDNVVLGHDSVLKALGLSRLPGASGHGLDKRAPEESATSEYAFMAARRPAGPDPVTWSSCGTIHLVVNGASAPAQANQLLDEAIARVTELSSLKIVVDGTTDEGPSDHRTAKNANPFKGQWAPVLVAWTTPEIAPALAGPVAGVAGPAEAPASYPNERRFVSGVVYLDGPAISEVLQRENGWVQARALVMHELGHLVGLAHVATPTELMAETNTSGVTDFGPGDRMGLSKLGEGPCVRW